MSVRPVNPRVERVWGFQGMDVYSRFLIKRNILSSGLNPRVERVWGFQGKEWLHSSKHSIPDRNLAL